MINYNYKNNIRALLILEYLLAQTDENHFVTIVDINNYLVEHNLISDRNTITDCIQDLQAVDQCVRSTQNRYYINKR